MGQVDGVALIGPACAQLFAAGGATDRAANVLKRSRAAAVKLGQQELVDQIDALAVQIRQRNECDSTASPQQ